MKKRRVFRLFGLWSGFGLLVTLAGPCAAAAEPTSQAVLAFNAYATEVEARLGQQHRSQDSFLFPAGTSQQSQLRIRSGEPIIEHLAPSTGADLPGALLHHWRGTAFIPGGRAADFERLLKDFNSYPKHFSPQVLRAKILTQSEDRIQASLRVRQKHVLTVVMDANYDVTFGRLDNRHGYSASKSVSITEIHAPGTDEERPLSSNEEHGFLWRLNTYWTYEQRADGLYIQIESLSLSRSVPVGLGWAIRPYVESVPRESLEFTLRSARNAMLKTQIEKGISPLGEKK
jgi:hypothetical protein